jgi:hypothetical protein
MKKTLFLALATLCCGCGHRISESEYHDLTNQIASEEKEIKTLVQYQAQIHDVINTNASKMTWLATNFVNEVQINDELMAAQKDALSNAFVKIFEQRSMLKTLREISDEQSKLDQFYLSNQADLDKRLTLIESRIKN